MSEISTGLGPDMGYSFYGQQELITRSPGSRGATRTIESPWTQPVTEAFLPEGTELSLSSSAISRVTPDFDKWGDPIFSPVQNSTPEEAATHFGLEY